MSFEYHVKMSEKPPSKKPKVARGKELRSI
jgi:hypothetical protein